jgi:hypothetical protein
MQRAYLSTEKLAMGGGSVTVAKGLLLPPAICFHETLHYSASNKVYDACPSSKKLLKERAVVKCGVQSGICQDMFTVEYIWLMLLFIYLPITFQVTSCCISICCYVLRITSGVS